MTRFDPQDDRFGTPQYEESGTDLPTGPEGVYHAVKPDTRLREEDLYVPRFLSPAFFEFLRRFVANPTQNALFAKEWRSVSRRIQLGGMGMRPVILLIMIAVSVLAPAVSIFIRATPGAGLQEIMFLSVFFGPAIGAGFLAFLAGLQGGTMLSDPGTLEQITVTHLMPQEVAFGYLAGRVVPLSTISLAMLPGLAYIAFDLTMMDPVSTRLNALLGLSLVLFFYPNLLTSMLSGAAISLAVTYRISSLGTALSRALPPWAVINGVTLMILAQSAAPMIMIGGFGILIGILVPFHVLFKFCVAAGFLNHLAVRIARMNAEEDMEYRRRNQRSTSA